MTSPSGILLLAKPSGITSHDAVNQIRKLYATKQVGHTGTLDPMATGLLTVLIGRAVKASDYAMAARKRYRATLRLGITTDTEDTTGTILTQADTLPSAEQVAEVIPAFVGDLLQIPPMVSAIKVGGKKLCDLARQGVEIPREARPITIYSLTAEPIEPENGTYRLDVVCSKGTYIRTLCADIGRRLGCGGAMASLCRTENGGHSLCEAHTLTELAEMSPGQRYDCLHPIEELFADYPRICLPAFYARLSHDGNPIYLEKLPVGAITAAQKQGKESEGIPPSMLSEGTLVRLYDGEGFFALGRIARSPSGITARMEKMFRLKNAAASPQTGQKAAPIGTGNDHMQSADSEEAKK